MKSNGLDKLVYPSKSIAIASLLTALMIAMMAWVMLESSRFAEQTKTRYLALERLRGEILHYDEVLTMSARMAAATGETSWIERYLRYEPKLDEAIRDAIALSESEAMAKAARETDVANKLLVGMERRSFGAVHEGDLAHARALLSSNAYKEQKSIYAEGMRKMVELLRAAIDERISEQQRVIFAAIVAALFLFFSMVLIWVGVYRAMGKWREAMVATIEERAMAQAALSEAHGELEKKVEERTAKLTQEITEKQRMETALRESEERFRGAFETAAHGMGLVSTEGRWLKVNQALCDIVGYEPDELMATDFQTITHPDDLDADLECVRRVLADEIRTYQMEKRYIHKDGRYVWILLSVSLVRDMDGEPVHFVSQIQDISVRKKAEAKLAAKSAELERSNAELKQFAYVASHDLQEPLNLIDGYLNLLADEYKGKLSQDADEFIDHTLEAAGRMKGLIRDLLAFSRVESKGAPFKPTDLNGAFEEARSNIRARIEETDAKVKSNPLPMVLGDRSQIVRVLQNLISNAIKFAKPNEKPVIRVSAHQSEGRCVISVRDNGVGVPKEAREKIFEIFHRLHPRHEYPGTGIGLAICKRIVERHGGRIWVESEPGEGSAFFFNLPCGD